MDVLPIDLDAPLVRLKLTADQFQQRGLAGAAGAHDGGDLSPGDLEIHAIENHAATAGKVEIPNLNERLAEISGGTGHKLGTFRYLK